MPQNEPQQQPAPQQHQQTAQPTGYAAHQMQYAPMVYARHPFTSAPYQAPYTSNISYSYSTQPQYPPWTAEYSPAAPVAAINQEPVSTTPLKPRTKHRLPIIDPSTMQEVKVDDDSRSESKPKPNPVTTSLDDTKSPPPPSVSETLLQKVSEETTTVKEHVVENKNNDAMIDKDNIEKKVIDVKSDVKEENSVEKHIDVAVEEKENVEEEVRAMATSTTTTTNTTITSAPPDVETTNESATEKDHEQAEQQQNQEQGNENEKDDSKLIYEDGQYNPYTNRNGKKKYSKEFMIKVCESICKLKVFDDNSDDTSRHETFQLNNIDHFAPSFSRNFQPTNRQSEPTRRQNQTNYMGRTSAGQEKQRKVIISSSLTKEVELKTVDNPWRPAKEVKEDIPVDVVEVEAVKKKFRSILNKLTPNNFDNLALAVTELGINTETKLGEVIDIVFAKALAEPGYCVLYGQMCSHLKKITAGTTNFGNTLLKRCQNQFNSDIYSGLNIDERKKKIEEEQDSDAKKHLNEELYEEMYRCRMRGLGLIKFIGELYKIEMLNDKIMFDCIQRLLYDSTSEESLECLCDLLATIGEKLDKSSQISAKEEKRNRKQTAVKGNAYQSGKSVASVVASGGASKVVSPEFTTLDPVFERLEKIRNDKESPISIRIKFKLLDLYELREKDRWKSKRTKDNNPKKIEEIREAHREKLELERQKNAMGPRRSQEGRRLGQSGSSSQLSALANEGNRGGANMHPSASSHSIRDQNFGDNTRQNDVDPNYVNDYLKFRNVFAKTTRESSQASSQATGVDLRPLKFGQPHPNQAQTKNEPEGSG